MLRTGVLKEINEKFSLTKQDPIAISGDAVVSEVPVISTGLPSLDIALGRGLPLGRVVEIFGPAASGKTSLALQLCKAMQATGEDVVYIDAEHAINVSWLNTTLDPSRYTLVHPHFGEAATDVALAVITGGAGLVVIDSVPALTPKAEYESSMEEHTRGALARMMGQFMRKVAPLVFHSGTVLVMINQIRSNMSPYGNPETTPGGKALEYAASLRLRVKKDEDIKQGTEVIGQRSSVSVVKNKVATPRRVAQFDLLYSSGIDTLASLLDASETLGVTAKKGAWITFGDVQWQGKEKAKYALVSDTRLLFDLTVAVQERLSQ